MQTISAGFTGTERFELLRQIGEGGFGVVYEALDRERSARVALKVLRDPEGASLMRFKREFRVLAEVSHRNLVAPHELLNDGRHWFFTMDLVNGEPLTRYVRPAVPVVATGGSDSGPLDEKRLRHVLPQLVEALESLHRLGIVHRDIKPSNMLVTAEGRLVILDFGLVSDLEPALVTDGQGGTATIREESAILGTASYMAPEQAETGGASPAADYYSVGVVLYEALTGTLPYQGNAYEQLLAKRSVAPRPPGDINKLAPKDLCDLTLELLRADPNERVRAIGRLWALAGVPDSELPGSRAGSAPLVGRQSHLESLQEAYQLALQGATVITMVSGVSGMGKTALVRQFLSDLRSLEQPDLIALTSRCYERESTPYKAIDPLVDTITRYLRVLDTYSATRLLPQDAGLLARLFPVMQAIEEVRIRPETGIAGLDSIAIRRRAAAALREMFLRFSSLGGESGGSVPLVVWIDDAQWGDLDSAAILEQVLQPPDAPPMLLIASYRSEDVDAPLVSALQRLGRRGTSVQAHSVVVGPLSPDESRTLATHLTSADSRTLAAVASESGGNPFFVYELARSVASGGLSERADLQGVITERLRALPDPARRMMAAVALSAQAVSATVAEAASAAGDAAADALRLLGSSRLVRVSGQSDARAIEPYHDRIREAVIGQLDEATLQDCHRQLALAWERSGVARPETLTTHFNGAGDAVKTVRYAAIAAEHASQALAFDRAADLYALLVRLEQDPEKRRKWQIALGDALVNCGRGFEAAAAYQSALPLTTGDEVIDLEGRAAAELIRAGYLEEATQVLNRLLPKVGVRPPGSHLRSILTLLTYRTMIGWRGLAVEPKPEAEVPPDVLRRLDVLVAIAPPLTLISLPRGLSLNMKAVWNALNAGEPKRAAVGIALFASSITIAGTRTYKRALEAVALARALAEPLHDPWTTARTELAEGICYKVSGFWKQGIQVLETAIATFTQCPGARWEIETARTLRHDAMIWTGDWKRLANELPGRLNDAQQRGDRYSAAQVTGRLSPLMRLAEDRVDDARAEAEAAQKIWRKPHFNLQHRAALCAWLDIDLYDGRAGDARRRLKGEWRALRGTLALFQNGRIEAESYRARIGLALMADGEARIRRDVMNAIRRLEKEDAAYATALALLFRAALRYDVGDTDDAVGLLNRGEQACLACDMRLFAAAARYRRGRIVGGDQGDELVRSAVSTMSAEGIVKPERIAALLVPGSWTAA